MFSLDICLFVARYIIFTGFKGGNLKHGQKYFATVTATNNVGQTVSAYSKAISVDDTPPIHGLVIEHSGIHRINASNPAARLPSNRLGCGSEEGRKTSPL